MKRKNIIYFSGFIVLLLTIYLGSTFVTNSKYTPAPFAEVMPTVVQYNDYEAYLKEHPEVEFLFIYQENEQNSEYIGYSVLPNLFALYPSTDFSKMLTITLDSTLSIIEEEAIKQKLNISTIPSILYITRNDGKIVSQERFDWSMEEHIELSSFEEFFKPYSFLSE